MRLKRQAGAKFCLKFSRGRNYVEKILSFSNDFRLNRFYGFIRRSENFERKSSKFNRIKRRSSVAKKPALAKRPLQSARRSSCQPNAHRPSRLRHLSRNVAISLFAQRQSQHAINQPRSHPLNKYHISNARFYSSLSLNSDSKAFPQICAPLPDNFPYLLFPPNKC